MVVGCVLGCIAAAPRTRGKHAAEKPHTKLQPAKRHKVGGTAFPATAPPAPVPKRRAPVPAVKQAVKNLEDSEPEAPPPKSARSVERSRGGKRTSGKHSSSWTHSLCFSCSLYCCKHEVRCRWRLISDSWHPGTEQLHEHNPVSFGFQERLSVSPQPVFTSKAMRWEACHTNISCSNWAFVDVFHAAPVDTITLRLSVSNAHTCVMMHTHVS